MLVVEPYGWLSRFKNEEGSCIITSRSSLPVVWIDFVRIQSNRETIREESSRIVSYLPALSLITASRLPVRRFDFVGDDSRLCRKSIVKYLNESIRIGCIGHAPSRIKCCLLNNNNNNNNNNLLCWLSGWCASVFTRK